MKSRCFHVVVLLLISLLAALPGAVILAQGGGEDEIVLMPFINSAHSLQGVVPRDWFAISPGGYARRSGPMDVAAILLRDFPAVTADQIAAALLPEFGLEALPEDVTARETDAFAWSLYVIELETSDLGTVVVDLALAETDTAAYFVLMQTLSDEHEALHQAVFLPVVDALAPITLAWPGEDPAADEGEPQEVAALVPEVLAVIPHDTSAYTQGFLLHDGSLYESTGLRGQSTLRQVDPASGEVLRLVEVPDRYFAEGLALVDDRLIQLTWQEHEAFVYDLETFEQIETYTYATEGWGLCYDGEYLYLSDGSAVISIRDPQTFELLYMGQVTLDGQPVERLNELECVGDTLYANVWQTDVIMQIDKSTGRVLAVINAAGLLSEAEVAALASQSQDVLNGIAYNPDTDTFLITGKRWPSMFEVRFVPAEGEGDEGG